ncbi:hypothetical protein K491DRAFT_429898 [Lophiostoma macrostomum CBS 122681]|uniref:F-box domain-containing protein n=1 Tax=Lophiostoma macrostomum CBS 122681 TaxID=1314788 RepID=A0A6A6T7Z9_9PLEO|nr:hypothetical protein K491DRAFT_429898 [Lophiostoma macrostomum CBS 122681]
MSSASEPAALATTDSHGKRHQTMHERTGEDTKDKAIDTDEKTTFSARHSDILRHVFPRPSSRNTSLNKGPDGSIMESKRRKVLSSLPRQSRPRVAFHKVITSFFSHPAGSAEEHNKSPLDSSASSTSNRSKAGSASNSAPSLEIVSPGTFLFSGPSLRSAFSGSLTSSTSRLPSLTGNGSECFSFHRTGTGSLSLDNVSLVEDDILEPYIECHITRSMSDVLRGLSTPFDEIERPLLERPNGYEHHGVEDSVGRHDFDCTRSMAASASLVTPYLEFASWKALRLTCRSWHSAFTLAAPPKFPPSYNVPTEILQHVYGYLGPLDFNCCRRVCRDWMRASLNKNLLVAMLKRGGWWNSADSAFQRREQRIDVVSELDQLGEEWFLSRLLARECSLCSGWTGNGLDMCPPYRAIAAVSQTNFADLASGYSDTPERHNSGLVFTTSVCGRLLLVARETLVYVYELSGTTLRPVTSVVCPRRVLSMSMDISSGRNAVAALLEGRMGIVCELRFGQASGSESPVEVEVETNTHAYRTTTRASILTSRTSDFGDGLDVPDHVLSTTHRSGPRRNWTNFSSVNVQANHDAVTLHDTDDHRTHNRNWINHEWNFNIRGSPAASDSARQNDLSGDCLGNIPIETGTSTFYRHLCSEDDPPRSVSICPQRRCVAFGCSAGIELHWIDALTGQSLSR